MSKIVLILLLAAAMAPAGSKDRDWQRGKVLDNTANPYFAVPDTIDATKSSQNKYGDTAYEVNNSSAGKESVLDNYVIETEDSVYLIERIRMKLSKSANVKKYTLVKFAVEKNKLWLVDGDGKQHQTKIVEQKRKSL